MLKMGMLALLLATAGAQATDRLAVQAAGESVMTMRVDGDLLIDTEGRVKEYSLRTALDPKLRQMLDKSIPAWRMTPVLLDGKPVSAKTPMRIVLVATEVPAGFEVPIENVVFAPITPEDYKAVREFQLAAREQGEIITAAGEVPRQPVSLTKDSMRPPGYPVGLMRAEVEGMVLLTLRLNPDGTVADVMASQSSLLNVKGRPTLLDKARALLETESIRAAKRWKYKVDAAHPELLEAEDLTVRVPVEFRMSDTELAGTWRYEFRGPNLPVPWLLGKEGDQVVGVSDLANGDQVSGASPFRLSDRSVLNRAL